MIPCVHAIFRYLEFAQDIDLKFYDIQLGSSIFHEMIFLDLVKAYFIFILHFLRIGKCSSTEKPAPWDFV